MLLLTLACSSSPQGTTDTAAGADSAEPPAPPTLLVSGYTSGTLHRIDPATGEVIAVVSALPGAQSVRPSPDGDLYVVAEEDGAVRILDGADLTLKGTLAEGLSAPTAAVAREDGVVWIGEFGGDQVLRLAPADDAPVALASKLDGVDAGMILGPDGLLWVPCFDSDLIVALDPDTGEIRQTLAGAETPRSLWFDELDRLWVTSWRGNSILRYTGETPETIANAFRPAGMVADPDGTSIWISTDQRNTLTRLDRESGEVLEEIDGEALGVEGATFLSWMPEG